MLAQQSNKDEVEYRELGGIYWYKTPSMKTYAPCKDANGNTLKVPKIPKIC